MARLPAVIFFMKGKLSPIDTHLPLLMELLSSCIVEDVIIFCSDSGFKKLLGEQKLLTRALKESQIRIYIKPKDLNLIDKIQFYLKCLLLLKIIFYKKILFFGIKDLPNLYKIFLKINRLMCAGKSFYTSLHPMNDETYHWFNNVVAKQFGRTKRIVDVSDVDIILSSREVKDDKMITNDRAEFINIGYVRGMRCWRNFIDKFSCEDLGDVANDDFFFWPLSVLSRDEPNSKFSLEEQILETIDILYEINFPLKIVFRYHPTTDREIFQALLERTGFKNYTFSNAHPDSLISRARFIFSNSGTTLFCDAHYAGCPVVQYSSLKHSYTLNDDSGMPTASVYQPVVDHFATNREDFIDVLTHLLNDVYQKRNDVRKNMNRPFVIDSLTLKSKLLNIIN